MKPILSKIPIIFTIICLIVALTACKGQNGGNHSAPPSTMSSTSNLAGNASDSGNHTLTISVIFSDPFLDIAKQKFEAAFPNEKVEFITYQATPASKGEDQVDIGKYVSSVTTQLASGKGADIIVVNELPFEKLADKKYLADLNEFMDKDSSFDRNSYYGNIFEAVKSKQGLFVLPTSAQIENLWYGDSEALQHANFDDMKWTWQDFVEVLQPLVKDTNNDGSPDRYALTGVQTNSLLGRVLGVDIGNFVDAANQKATFDSPAFIKLLKDTKSMLDTKLIIPVSPNNERSMDLFIDNNFRSLDETVMYLQMFFHGKAKLYKAPSVAGGDQGYSFRTNMLLSINSKTKNKELAWQFLKFLLSDEMQSDRSLNGLPINRNVFKAQEQQLLNRPDQVSKSGETIKAPAQAELDKMEAYMMGIKRLKNSDDTIFNMVNEQTNIFFSGQKTAEEAAKTIQGKVDTYLKE